MNQSRPVNLNLMTIRFPIMAIVSILHRITGVVLFLGIPFMLYGLQQSLHSLSSFHQLKDCLQHGVIRAFLWVYLTSLAFHLIAGIRHMVMDLGLGESVCGARLGAYVVLGLSIISAILMGAWIW